MALLEHQGRRATFEGGETAAETAGLPRGVKAPTPPTFNDTTDGDTVKNFTDALDTYFDLVGITNQGLNSNICRGLIGGQGSNVVYSTKFPIRRG